MSFINNQKIIFRSLKLASEIGSSKLLSRIKKEWGQQFLFDQFQNQPGLPTKFSQWLSQKWDLDPKSQKSLLSTEEIKQILIKDCPSLYSVLEFIDSEAYPASMGQVHRIKIKNDIQLALKVQYPGLKLEVQNQLNSLLWLMEQSPAKKFGMDFKQWGQETLSFFEDELDFRNELRQQQRFFEQIGHESWMITPRVYPEWNQTGILVQDWVEGWNLNFLLTQDSNLKKMVAKELAHCFIRSILTLDLFHADWQPGNWAWCPERSKIILYDYGACIDWPTNRQRSFEYLIESIKANQSDSAMKFLVVFGFDTEKLKPIYHVLPLLLRSLLEPFWNFNLRKISEWSVGEKIQQQLGDASWYFRSAGPPWFLLLMRSFNAFFKAIEKLDDSIVLAEIYEEEVNRLPLNRWEGFDKEQFKSTSTQSEISKNSFNDISQFLRVSVYELDSYGNKKEEKVSLRLPISSIYRIEELIEPMILKKIIEMGLSLDEIKSKALRNGLLQQDLFTVKTDHREVHVWISR